MRLALQHCADVYALIWTEQNDEFLSAFLQGYDQPAMVTLMTNAKSNTAHLCIVFRAIMHTLLTEDAALLRESFRHLHETPHTEQSILLRPVAEPDSIRIVNQ